MNLFRRRNPGRALARLSAESRRLKARTAREKMLAVTRQLRAETGLPPHPALEG